MCIYSMVVGNTLTTNYVVFIFEHNFKEYNLYIILTFLTIFRMILLLITKISKYTFVYRRLH